MSNPYPSILIRIYAEFADEAAVEERVFISPEEEELHVAETKIRVEYEQKVNKTAGTEDEDDLPGCERRRFLLGSVPEGSEATTTLHLREDWDLPHIGGRVWQCAVYFSQWLHRHGPDLLQDASVVELGAGAGLPGLIASAYAKNTMVTDFGDALLNLAHNMRLNEDRIKSHNLEALDMDWREVETSSVQKHSADIVLATEVVYSDATCQLFFQALEWTMKRGGVCYLAQDITRYGVPELMEALNQAGMEVHMEEVPEWIKQTKVLYGDDNREEYFKEYRFCAIHYKDEPCNYRTTFSDV